MGQGFAKEFEVQGCEVLVSERSTELTNRDIVARGDIVIVTVPIRDVEHIIEEIAPVINGDALFTDFTSV